MFWVSDAPEEFPIAFRSTAQMILRGLKAQADMSWLLASILLVEPRPWTRIKPDSVLSIFKRCPRKNLWVLLDKIIIGA